MAAVHSLQWLLLIAKMDRKVVYIFEYCVHMYALYVYILGGELCDDLSSGMSAVCTMHKTSKIPNE